VLVAFALLASAAVSTRADDERPRTWPEEWPIVPAPIRGPLPPNPAPGLFGTPATTAAQRVVQVIDHVRANLRSTRYHHHLSVREREGRYYWDCSLMSEWVLERAAPRSVSHMESLSRPLAEHFVRTIEQAPTDGYRRGWQRVANIEDVRPGDVFAWRRPPGFPSRNSGHVGFALERPRPVPRIHVPFHDPHGKPGPSSPPRGGSRTRRDRCIRTTRARGRARVASGSARSCSSPTAAGTARTTAGRARTARATS
jgi:hypothetical protein